jgi:uncharacterized Zn-binding protein involved in type VI secretion
MIQPVPLSAHYGEMDCFWGLCDPIPMAYSPTIAVPTQIRDLNPLWKNCAIQLWGIMDPPSAVETIGVLTKSPQDQNKPSASNAAQPSPTSGSGWPSKKTAKYALSEPTATPTPGAIPFQSYPQAPTTVAIVGSTTVTAGANRKVIIGSHTLQNGGPPATISGTVLSLGATGIIMSDTRGVNTVVLASVVTLPPTAIFTVNGQPVTASQGPSGVTIDGTVVPEDGCAITIHENLIRPEQIGLDIGGTSFVQWFSFQAQPSTIGALISATGGDVITAMGRGSDGYTIIAAGNTISIGGPPCTVNGKVYSVAPSGLVVGSTSTVPLSALSEPTSAFEVLTINGHPITVYPVGSQSKTVVISSTMLSLGGPPVNIDGQKISLGYNGLVICDSTTIPSSQSASASSLPTGLPPQSTGIGNYIRAGLGGQSTSSATSSHSTGIGDYNQTGLDGSPVRKSPVIGEAAQHLPIPFVSYLVLCAVSIILNTLISNMRHQYLFAPDLALLTKT